MEQPSSQHRSGSFRSLHTKTKCDRANARESKRDASAFQINQDKLLGSLKLRRAYQIDNYCNYRYGQGPAFGDRRHRDRGGVIIKIAAFCARSNTDIRNTSPNSQSSTAMNKLSGTARTRPLSLCAKPTKPEPF